MGLLPSLAAYMYTFYKELSLALFSLYILSLDKIIHVPELNSHFHVGGF